MIDDQVIKDWRRDIEGDPSVYPGYRQKLLLLLDEVERLRAEGYDAMLLRIRCEDLSKEVEWLRTENFEALNRQAVALEAKRAKAVVALRRIESCQSFNSTGELADWAREALEEIDG